MEKIKDFFGESEYNKYKSNYINVNDYNFTNKELKEIKKEFNKNDFIKFTVNELYKNGSLNFRNLIIYE